MLITPEAFESVADDIDQERKNSIEKIMGGSLSYDSYKNMTGYIKGIDFVMARLKEMSDKVSRRSKPKTEEEDE